jgi:predicted ester cyclase
MPKPAFLENQKPGTDYGALKSLVTELAPETRSNAQLTEEERRNLECYLAYKAAPQPERPRFQTANHKIHRRGFVHLSALMGAPGQELAHGSLQDRYDEIEDVIVKGDRLWAVFTLRAKHVGTLYGVPATGKDVAFLEMCVLRFEDGKIAEGWFFGDEGGICRQLGIEIKVAGGA